MDFRFTKLKVIISLVFGFCSSLLYLSSINVAYVSIVAELIGLAIFFIMPFLVVYCAISLSQMKN